ncbi:hypothetical protein LOZ65_006824 [Ophidiomyces ophidiicola]|nr:hypothetical protein LOZ65_006824 [Ophidiomyces ophidiicola]
MEDELAALSAQMEGIKVFEETQKGKYPLNRPPDPNLALTMFESDLQLRADFLLDLKFAQSIAIAVAKDWQAIAEIALQENQTQEDRRLAMLLSCGDSINPEAPPPYNESNLCSRDDNVIGPKENLFDLSETQAAYLEQQETALQKLTTKSTCDACLESSWLHELIHLPCRHGYCYHCLETLFMRSTVDESLFPPRCCGQIIPLPVILDRLSIQQVGDF